LTVERRGPKLSREPPPRPDAMGAIHVREACPDDAETIAAWQLQMARETEGRELDAGRVRRGVARALGDPVCGRYLVAEWEGRPVGSLLLTREWSDWRDGWFWWIQSVYLDPQARGRGIFRALYAAVLEQARADGEVCGLRLYVEQHNQRARSIYAALGMQETDYRLYELDFGA
jgi:GNAT superfamily N-acetyltransferase